MLDAVIGVHNIASTLGGEKGQNTSKNSDKHRMNYFTQRRIMFWILIWASSCDAIYFQISREWKLGCSTKVTSVCFMQRWAIYYAVARWIVPR